MVGELELYLFKQGTNYRAYEFLGAHKCGEKEYVFRVWAPNADKVYLAGDFNDWGMSLPMTNYGGVWAIKVKDESFENGVRYKYIIDRGGVLRYKADPYAFYSETLAKTASRLFDLDGFKWTDGSYLKTRKKDFGCLAELKTPSRPMNIYEVHLGSWQRDEHGDYLNYRELADRLSAYVKRMGYTHVELLPVAEHPFDGSWGYQVCGYYAPTSRFGTPHDFMYFVDKMHASGIGVIMDWVPAHFPKDAHGLYEFDGGPLYEYQGEDRKENREWGTRCFDVGRNEVQCFLISNALYWADKYHIDGLRVDAVSSMLYLDYGRKPGEWNPNPDGSNINLQSVAFFQKLNSIIRSFYPDFCMIAEEATAYQGITDGRGLGFNLKWNMGWMNDTLRYVAVDSVFRKSVHHRMTFSIMYAFNEKFVLPISHDEVVHGKLSLLDKMAGDYWQKFACMRTYLSYMMTHPGKKLLFMGCEYAPFREWDFQNSLEWFMLDYDMHANMQKFVCELNHLYLRYPCFWEIDDSFDGFQWVDADNADENLYIYRRMDKKGEVATVILNFSPVVREKRIKVPEVGRYIEVLNSDDPRFGGSGQLNSNPMTACFNGDAHDILVKIPPLGASVIIKEQAKRDEK